MRSDPLTCVDVADDLTATVDGEVIGHRAGGHVAVCLRCQAEVAQFRRLGRTLRDLRRPWIDVPEGVEHEIIMVLDLEDRRLRRRGPANAAAAVGAIAAAAGVIALTVRGVTRQRRVARLAF